MTIRNFVRLWREGDDERTRYAEPVERVVDLWYAHGAQLPRTDSLRRRSPLQGESVETQGWAFVEKHVPQPLLHALAGTLASDRTHPVTDALAFKALDALMDLEAAGHGFLATDRYEPPCGAELAEDDANGSRVAQAVAEVKGLLGPKERNKRWREDRTVYGHATRTERRKGWNGTKKGKAA